MPPSGLGRGSTLVPGTVPALGCRRVRHAPDLSEIPTACGRILENRPARVRGGASEGERAPRDPSSALSPKADGFWYLKTLGSVAGNSPKPWGGRKSAARNGVWLRKHGKRPRRIRTSVWKICPRLRIHLQSPGRNCFGAEWSGGVAVRWIALRGRSSPSRKPARRPTRRRVGYETEAELSHFCGEAALVW